MKHYRPEPAAAAFEYATSALALAEGPELVLTAQNFAARTAYGDRTGLPLGAAFPSAVTSGVVELASEVYRTGSAQVRDELRLELPGAGPIPDLPGEVFVRLSLSPTLAADGSVDGVLLETSDVTASVYAKRAADARSADAKRGFDAAADTLVVLQDALLPEGLPVVPRLQLAARYLLAEDGPTAGGDWFDAMALADGRTVLVVGDAVGHGVRASVVMGELRTLFEERVRVDGDVLGALDLLERRARRVAAARAATVCVAIVDADRRAMRYCTAGHPPPLLVGEDGEARYLPLTGGAPLGSGQPFPMAEVPLSPGDTLVLYSDGLVQRPGRSTGQNTLDLAQTVARLVRAAPEDRCGETLVELIARETVEQLSLVGGVEDDVSLVAAQVVEPIPDLAMTMPAFPDALRAVRHNVADWLASHHIDELDELALQHAVGELVSNVVEHAYPPDADRDTATVTVSGRLRPDGAVELTVTDRGRWRPAPAAGGRGRGLAMAQGFADELEISDRAEGTTVCVRHWPRVAVSLLTSSGPRRPSLRAGSDSLVVSGDGPVVAVSGALDGRTADELRHRLGQVSRGGTKTVHLDLSDVLVLASAGVQVLYEAGAGLPRSPLVLVAPAGSVAQHVLELVQLPYLTQVPDDETPGGS
ncbi:SpoIIE family protein phosphatase [Nocardioides pantholopis]|uniref:SpoIIE family protein phosphatase n=1 Tax=Nocardioides pantholopis TaxID=2483798 RepID=UPI000F078D6F|nr:SpoIIE family protein phosphatase [Nocardioides pantholopis]